ncbi:MAG: hypothetical protein AAGA48_04890 [Myxococcota bacterium]
MIALSLLLACDQSALEAGATDSGAVTYTPEVELLSPAPDSTFEIGDRIDFEFSVWDGPDDISDLALTWTLSGLRGQPSLSDLRLDDPGRNHATASWRTAEAGQWEVALVASDPAHRIGEAFVTFSVDDRVVDDLGQRWIVEGVE